MGEDKASRRNTRTESVEESGITEFRESNVMVKGRTPEQERSEKIMRFVGDAMLAIEEASREFADTLTACRDMGADAKIIGALEEAITGLEQVRKRVWQQAYLGGGRIRLELGDVDAPDYDTSPGDQTLF
ncbi:MAG: hypothetical protein DCC49_04745 [Acidobacteria bacterium]|nr:MAG: hypothetical protein DCC49_04745 [Acidobacteriota bacterium]